LRRALEDTAREVYGWVLRGVNCRS